jgi:hypothetical protein
MAGVFVRKQVQLTHQQSLAVARLATERRVSEATLVREAVDLLLARDVSLPAAARRAEAMSIVGVFSSDASDVSAHHDQYLADALRDA